MIVVVTGATGFVGRRCCEVLLRAGVHVRAMTRGARAARSVHAGGTPSAGVEWVPYAGLHDVDALVGAMAGAAAVVHLAARVHVMRETTFLPDEAFAEVNVRGTHAVLDAMTVAGVSRLVLASSVKAVGERTTTRWSESVPPAPEDAYGRSKRAAELEVERWAAAANGRAAAILRLPLVYGPGAGGNVRRLTQLVARGVPVPVPTVANRRSLVYVGNVAAAVAGFVAAPAWHGAETYFVADDRPVSTEELVRAIGDALGRRARVLRVPVGALQALGRIGDAAAVLVPWPLTSAAVQRLTGSLELDTSKLRRALGGAPPYSLAEGLSETADAWRQSTRQPSTAGP